MKKALLLTLCTIFLLISSIAFAKTLKPELKLLSLKALVSSEHAGDELYMMIVVYPSDAKPSHFHIPQKPLYWPSEHLEKLKLVNLWSNEIKQDQAVTLIISLMDKDAPPWNTDDLIGEIKVQMKNNNGVLESNWSTPNRNDPPTAIMSKYGEAKKFELFGEGAKYEAYFLLK